MPVLSEKAKGKQRAEISDVSNDVPSTSHVPMQREVVIRFTEGVEDLVVYVGEKDVVKDVKAKIRSQRTEVANRRLRLIYSGRLLANGTLLFACIKSLEERNNRTESKEDAATSSTGQQDGITWLHCSVGPVMGIEESDEVETAQATQILPLRGFDRLQAAGFSEEEIASIRRQFHSSESTDQSNDVDIDIEDMDEHARNLEEQWIDSIDTLGSAALSQSSSSGSSTALQGLLLGFFFPILPFFLFREPHKPVFWEDGRITERLPSVVFSQRMQMAIVLGFVLNLLFGLWRFVLSS